MPDIELLKLKEIINYMIENDPIDIIKQSIDNSQMLSLNQLIHELVNNKNNTFKVGPSKYSSAPLDCHLDVNTDIYFYNENAIIIHRPGIKYITVFKLTTEIKEFIKNIGQDVCVVFYNLPLHEVASYANLPANTTVKMNSKHITYPTGSASINVLF